MAFGIFIHRADSIYRDVLARRYQFPKAYLTRATPCIGDWIIYYEPVKVKNTKGYFAAAKVGAVVPDHDASGMYYALIEPGSYVDFPYPVPFNGPAGVVEAGVLNEAGRNSGRAQSAVRPLSPTDFGKIVSLGMGSDDDFLPRTDSDHIANHLQEDRTDFDFGAGQDRTRALVSRTIRDRAFRQVILKAYDSRCALTGLRLINGGGRAEVEAAHIQPVEERGPDSVVNGLALSGTVHWMFDRGLISLSDDLEILISRQVNDAGSVRALLNRDGRALLPSRANDHPHPHFLSWHREHRFKQ